MNFNKFLIMYGFILVVLVMLWINLRVFYALAFVFFVLYFRALIKTWMSEDDSHV